MRRNEFASQFIAIVVQRTFGISSKNVQCGWKKKKIFYGGTCIYVSFSTLVRSFANTLSGFRTNTCGIDFNVLLCLSKRFGLWGLNGKTIWTDIAIDRPCIRIEHNVVLYWCFDMGLKMLHNRSAIYYHKLTLVENVSVQGECIGTIRMNWYCVWGG